MVEISPGRPLHRRPHGGPPRPTLHRRTPGRHAPWHPGSRTANSRRRRPDAAYRRRFAATAQTLTRASAEAPTDELFEILLEQGRALRRETKRRDSLTAGPKKKA